MPFVFAVAPHHPLAHEGAVNDADAAALPRRGRGRFGAAPVAADGQPAAGQDVLTVSTWVRQDRGAAARPGLRLRARAAGAVAGAAASWWSSRRSARPGATLGYAWRCPVGPRACAGRRRAWPAVVAAAAGQPHHAQGAAGAAADGLTMAGPTAAASRRRPPGRCTPARWWRRWPAGWTPARRAGAGWCASRTSTPALRAGAWTGDPRPAAALRPGARRATGVAVRP
jgi:hypothetical protein